MHYNSFSSNIILRILSRLDNLIMLYVKVELKTLYLLKTNNIILGAYINNNKGAVLECTTINLYIEINVRVYRSLNLVRESLYYNLV